MTTAPQRPTKPPHGWCSKWRLKASWPKRSSIPGVYLVCHPAIAGRLALTPSEALSGVQGILLRGTIVHGRLYRLTLTLLADQGEDVMLQTTAFVPEPEEAEHWGDLPCLLGLYGCLERIRFAVDPRAEQFYFGPAAEDA